MEHLSGEQTHFNGILAKAIGLHQMLDPKTIKYRGHNVYHIAAVLCTSYLFLFVLFASTGGIYIWKNDLINSLQHFGMSIGGLHICYKGYVVVRHSDKIRDVLSVVRFEFASCGLRYASVQGSWQNLSAVYTYTSTVLINFVLIIYMLFPLTTTDTYTAMSNHDGEINNYRLNIFNLYVFLSGDTYNKYFILFYLLEVPLVIAFMYLNNIYDMILITLSLSMSCQLNIVNTAFESIGHPSSVSYRRLSSTKDTDADKEIVVINECNTVYDEIISIITDRTRVIKKLELFISTFQNVILSQIFVSSSILIVMWFSAIVTITDEDMPDSRSTTLKMFSLVILYIFQIFVTSYLIGIIHSHKDAVIFALYSSNWTEMAMKCKKLILMTMRMNSAHHRKIKFTNTKIVNLEFFFITISYCYSMFSMLINYKHSKYQ